MYEAVKRRAGGARRSLNGQIVVMLEQAMLGEERACDGCGRTTQGPWYEQWLVGETPGVHDRPGAWLCQRCMKRGVGGGE